MNMFTFTATFCCLLFWIFICLVYFSKRNMSNLENKIYSYMVILDGILTIFSLVDIIVGNYLDVSELMMPIFDIASRIFCTALMLWHMGILFYVAVVISEKDEKMKLFLYGRSKKDLKIRVAIATFINALTFILPVNYSLDANGVLVCTGGRGYFMAVILFSIAFIYFGIIIAKRKILNTKKLIPFLIIIFLQIIAYSFELIDPSINVLPLSTTLISYLMYHTIENPDMRLITALQLAKNQAEKSNNAKSDFLSSMSHELRTPLNAIMGLSQMIEVNDNLEEIHEDARDIVMASENLLELVNGILDINKIDTNKMEVVEAKYHFEEIITEMTKMISVRIGNKPLTLRTKFDNQIPYELYGDKDKIKRIITNLLTNAVKYTDKGFVDFIVECKNEKNRSNLKIIVKDTGRGIKKFQLDKLFTRFNRLEEDRDSNIEGTGLGLAITKSLVDMLDGKIKVESEFGIGSIFTVELSQKIVALEPKIKDNV